MGHLFLRHGPLVHGPVETANDGLPDLAQVVDTLGDVDEDVGSRSLRAERPDLTGLAYVPVVCVRQVASTRLQVQKKKSKMKGRQRFGQQPVFSQFFKLHFRQ